MRHAEGRARQIASEVSLAAVDPSVPPDRVTRFLEAVLERLEHLEDALAFVVERVSRLTREELALLNRVWPVMVRAMKGDEFGAVDLIDLPVAAKLLSGYSAHALGWLLKRAEGLTIGGFKLERAGEDRHGALWRLAPSSAKVGARRSRGMS